MRRALLGLALVIAGVSGSGRGARAMVTEIHYVMGTYFRIDVADADTGTARAAMRWCFANTRRLERLFSRYDAGSELSRINGTSASSVPVSADTSALLQRSLALGKVTGGAFDVRVAPLCELWRSAGRWPEAAEIEAARARVQRSLAVAGGAVVRGAGVTLDFDGIAKGWAVDACVAEFRARGLESALLSLGESSIYGLGAPTRSSRGWRLVLRTLDGEAEVGSLTLQEAGLSVSTTHGHARDLDGVRVGHIVDPRSGQPVMEPRMAVVVAPTATAAEALSKALLIRETIPYAPGETGDVAAAYAGTLLVTPRGIHQTGTVGFVGARDRRPLGGAAEPLR